MNKRTRIGLIALITAALLLAIAIPVLAKGASSPKCLATWRARTPDGGVWIVDILGDLTLSWNGTTLTTTCTGNIPLGEPIGNSIYFDLDDMRELLCELRPETSCDIGTPFIYTQEMWGAPTGLLYQGETYYSINWTYLVRNNGDFVVERVFSIP